MLHSSSVRIMLNAKHAGKTFSRRQFEICFSYFSKKNDFAIPYILSPKETICMECHFSLFSVKNQTNIINSSSAEFAS